MTLPHSSDLSAIGGAHPGVKTQVEIESSNIMLGSPWSMEKEASLSNASNAILRDAEFRMTSFSDTNALPKYPTNTEICYYGAGTMSLSPDGVLHFNNRSNENGKSTFSVDKKNSQMYSDSKSTVMGSLDISTVDGYVLNPFVAIFPSTMFSPTKPFMKNIFPWMNQDYLKVLVVEGVLVGLLSLANKLVGPRKNPLSENTTRKQSERDMAVIIQDNQEIENQLFENSNI